MKHFFNDFPPSGMDWSIHASGRVAWIEKSNKHFYLVKFSLPNWNGSSSLVSHFSSFFQKYTLYCANFTIYSKMTYNRYIYVYVGHNRAIYPQQIFTVVVEQFLHLLSPWKWEYIELASMDLISDAIHIKS